LVNIEMRSEALPDVPTVGDYVPGYEASAWYGVGVPKNTPAVIVDKLNTEINAALANPKIKARFADLGGTVLPGHCHVNWASRHQGNKICEAHAAAVA
jgi:tripartite-type tricarboxylate transporter receptor subunit TctC